MDGNVLFGGTGGEHLGAAARITLNVPRLVMGLVLAIRAKNLQHIFSDKLAVFAGVINDDFDRLLTPVAGETQIKTVR